MARRKERAKKKEEAPLPPAKPSPVWPPPVRPIDRSTMLLLAIMLLANLFLYWRAFGYGYTEWDDGGYVADNMLLKGFSWAQCKVEFGRNAMGNYHPITMLSYAVDISIGGKAPHMFHVTNVVLHVANGLLVFAFLRLLIGESLMAAFAALLFSMDPMRVENVAWISDRKDLLLVLFGMLTLIGYIIFLRGRKWPWLLGSFGFFVLACLSKATAVALVPTLVLIDLYWKRDMRRAGTWAEKLPFVIVALAIGLLTVPAQRGGIQYGGELQLPLPSRLLLGPANLVIYLAQLTVPIGLSALYEYADGGTRVPEGYVLLLPIVPLFAWLLYRWRSERALWFGAVFFTVNIALLLQFTPVGQAMRADRYAYLPSIGWALMVVVLVRMSIERVLGPRVSGAVLIAYAAVLGAVAHQRVPAWKDAMSLWDDMIAHDPKAQIALASRSGTWFKRGDYQRSLADANAALHVRHDDPLARYNRGLVQLKLEHYKEAVDDLLPYLGKPQADIGLYADMALGFMRTGRFPEALLCCDTVLKVDPDNTDILNKRAYCRTKLGRLPEAVVDIERSLRIRSDYAEVWYTRAFIDVALGDTAGGCAAMKRSMQWPLKEEALNKARANMVAHGCP